MLVKILGIIDLIAGLILLFGVATGLPQIILIPIGITFLIKSFLGGIPKDFGSLTDLIVGGIFLLMILVPVHYIICIIVGLCVIQKGIFSFL